jgi:transcriptional regulator with XRE-family HTH domain
MPHSVRIECVTIGNDVGNFKKLVGQKIRERRKIMGFQTQDALAKAIGADRTRISRWESGENLPDPVYKEALAKALGVDESFFEDIPSPAPSTRSELHDVFNAVLAEMDRRSGDSKANSDDETPALTALESHITSVGGADLLDALRRLTPENAVFVRMTLGLPDAPVRPSQAPSVAATRPGAPTSQAKKSAG